MEAKIKEKPILMSAPMVLALLACTKTQTRRIISKSNSTCIEPWNRLDLQHTATFADNGFPGNGYLHAACRPHPDEPQEAAYWTRQRVYPKWETGMRLWVRETWQSWRWNDKVKPSEFVTRWGKEDPKKYVGYPADDDVIRDGLRMDGKFRPSIFMPRWASRITREIVGIRCERVQEISEQDAIAEGIESRAINDPLFVPGTLEYRSPLGLCSTAKTAYEHLWDSINGNGSWKQNPFVWVLDFRRIEESK